MDNQPHILVVDDDREIRDLLARFLAKHGLKVSTAQDGIEMERMLDTLSIDLVVLDLMMPGEDGLSLTRKLRGHGSALPIVMLTAMGEDTDRIVGLEMGADDYLAKPFNPRELLARIKAVLRRANPGTAAGVSPTAAESVPGGTRYHFHGWQMDAATRDLLSPDGVVMTLSAGEFDLLLAFLEHPRRVTYTQGRLVAGGFQRPALIPGSGASDERPIGDRRLAGPSGDCDGRVAIRPWL